jgi:RHS repeat-associated protein
VNVRDGAGSLLNNYTYDQAGGRITSYSAIEGTTTYLYGDTDTTRMTGMTTPSGAVSFTYDNQGRVTSRTDSSGTTTYTWAYDGYLASVSLPNGTKVAYDYDASWRMVSRGESSGGATTTVTYQYDGNALVAERDSGGAVLASYVYGPDGRVETMSRGGETYQYVLDDHGSVTAVLDDTRAVVNTYTYDPYGKVVAKTEGVENPFTYSGYRVDADTGLFHLMARWYDSSTGRFLSKDAVQDVQGDPLSANHYLYCKNNPVNMVDPEGTYPQWSHLVQGLVGCLAIAMVVVGTIGIAIYYSPAITKWYLKKFLSKWNDWVYMSYTRQYVRLAGNVLWSEFKSWLKDYLKQRGQYYVSWYWQNVIVWSFSAGLGYERWH